MKHNSDIPAQSPEPLHLLISSLPPRVLIEFIKAHDSLGRVVLQGFSARDSSAKRPVVRQRLERELAKQSELAAELFTTWMDINAPLMRQVDDPKLAFSLAALQPLLKEFGGEVLEYALLHAQRTEAHPWAARIPEIRTYTPPQPARPLLLKKTPAENKVVADLQAKLAEVQMQYRTVEQERNALQREVATLKGQLDDAVTREIALHKSLESTGQQLERELRRNKKTDEETALLRKQLRHPQPEPEKSTPTPPTSPDAVATINAAIAILQQGLAKISPPAPAPRTPAAAKPAAPATPTRQAPEPTITLPKGRGKQTYPLSQITFGLKHNDMTLLEALRDGIARLAHLPEKEREALNMLAGAGIPRTVFTGPLRPAVIDGSNIANMSPQRKGRLAYLEQIRRSAWEEGYFPVVIIVDASLRHQIDQPEALMDLIERGEIEMAQAGTSADERLIEEAQLRNAILITNDRMTDWPQAKALEKRHAEMQGGHVHVGSFHRSTGWFHF